MRYIIFLTALLWGCGTGTKPSEATGPGGSQAPEMDKQINLTILLDLSDRIDPIENPGKPEHFERDSAICSYLANYFLDQMKEKGTHMARGKMRVVFHPAPANPDINLAAEKLSVDLSKMDAKGKKAVYETLERTVADNISGIYGTTIKQAVWPGSDIWRFFKNDVKEIAVDPDPGYRNILVVITDGYIYHADSKDNDGNRYAYILPDLFEKYGLRNDSRWEERMEKLDFGLICKRADLQELEVLVLEVSPSGKHRNDEDIIRKIMDKWFAEMKVKRWKIVNSDLPEFTRQRVEGFFQEAVVE